MTASSNGRGAIRAGVLIFLAVISFYLPFLDLPFSSKGEAREALVVKDMLEQQNYILPLRNGVEIPSKPPFFHWLCAASTSLAGARSEFAIRLPSLLLAAAFLALFYVFLRKREGGASAALATAILATALEWSRSASLARVDMTFSFLIGCASLLLFISAERWLESKKFAFLPALAAGLFTGAAVLTKGPAGLVLPWTWLGLFLLLRALKDRSLFRAAAGPAAAALASLALSSALAAVWYWLAYQQRGQDFLDVQLMRENVARLVATDNYEVGHEKPFFYSLAVLFSGFLPWSLFLPAVAVRLWQRRKELVSPAASFELYCAAWLLVFIVVCSIAVSKRTVYFLPAYPALAYLTARVIESGDLAAQKIPRWIAAGGLLILAAASVALLMGLPLAAYFDFQLAPKAAFLLSLVRKSMLESPLLIVPLLITATAVLIAAALLALKKRFRPAALYVSAAVALLALVLGHFFQPRLAVANSADSFMSEVSRRIPAGAQLYLYRRNYYPALYYSPRDIPVIDDKTPLAELSGAYIIARKSDTEALLNKLPSAAPLLTSAGLADDKSDWLVLFEFLQR